ncbi:hypothetical protein B0H11DRAFT_2253117 [Mycena galericulata]|nr:hypothetical protein B0H11DRAFT_2253117 [Mycena galericulata]
MPSLLPGSLSKADETVVRKLLKVVRATKYEDPVDQDDFLTDSANTVLNYRSRIDSFAVVAELGECVFTIRSMMHANGVRLGKPPSATFISLQDFAGEIVRKRQLFQERQRANAERVKVVEGMAARIARNEALEYASKQNDKPPISPDADAISIPSSSDDSAGDTQHAVEVGTVHERPVFGSVNVKSCLPPSWSVRLFVNTSNGLPSKTWYAGSRMTWTWR